MIYHDPVYGTWDITDPAVLELLASPIMERLKDIDAGGYAGPYFPGRSHSRFDHSVGVYLLLKKYDAPREEQIAGLIHDVSHSAFSHCIDYVLDEGSPEKQDHQDNVFDSFVRASAIPRILEKHGLNTDYILDDRNFPLKETELPDLCADRIDYSLRHAVLRYQKNANHFLENLLAVNRRWVFRTVETAQEFANYFRFMNDNLTASLGSAVMFRTVADTLVHALQKKYITNADLYTTDTLVLEKIRVHRAEDPSLFLLLDRMEGNVPYRNDPKQYTAHCVCKSRVVDPWCQHEGTIVRLSDVHQLWKDVVRDEMKPKEYFLHFER